MYLIPAREIRGSLLSCMCRNEPQNYGLGFRKMALMAVIMGLGLLFYILLGRLVFSMTP